MSWATHEKVITRDNKKKLGATEFTLDEAEETFNKLLGWLKRDELYFLWLICLYIIYVKLFFIFKYSLSLFVFIIIIFLYLLNYIII